MNAHITDVKAAGKPCIEAAGRTNNIPAGKNNGAILRFDFAAKSQPFVSDLARGAGEGVKAAPEDCGTAENQTSKTPVAPMWVRGTKIPDGFMRTRKISEKYKTNGKTLRRLVGEGKIEPRIMGYGYPVYSCAEVERALKENPDLKEDVPDGFMKTNEIFSKYHIRGKTLRELAGAETIKQCMMGNILIYSCSDVERALKENPGLKEDAPDGFMKMKQITGKYHISRKTLRELVDGKKVKEHGIGCNDLSVYSCSDVERALIENPDLKEGIPDGFMKTRQIFSHYQASMKILRELADTRKVGWHMIGSGKSAYPVYSCSDVERALKENPRLKKRDAGLRVPDGFMTMPEITSKYHISKGAVRTLAKAGGSIEKRVIIGHRTRVYSCADVERALESKQKVSRRDEIMAAVRIGLTNTRKEFHSEFIHEVLPPLRKVLREAFGTERNRDVKALKIIMEHKRLELEAGEEHYPLKPKQHWKMMLKEVQEWHELKEKALERTINIELTDKYHFERSKHAQDGRFEMDKEFTASDGQLVVTRVLGPRPWVISVHRNGEQMELTELLFDEHTFSRLQELDSYLKIKSNFGIHEFYEAMETRVGGLDDESRSALLASLQ